jgi:transposase
VADGNETDKAVFAQLMQEFRQQFSLDALMVADSALYSASNLKLVQGLRWISRVPLTVAEAKHLINELDAQQFVATGMPGYRIVERDSLYGGIPQKWVIVESEARKQADIKCLRQVTRTGCGDRFCDGPMLAGLQLGTASLAPCLG